MRMLMRLSHVFGSGMTVQFFDRVLVVVFRFLAGDMNVRMRVLVRVGMLVSVRMHYAIFV